MPRRRVEDRDTRFRRGRYKVLALVARFARQREPRRRVEDRDTKFRRGR
jgi:hypothetical protein